MRKQLLFFALTTITYSICFSQQYGSFKDARDGRTYKTVKIGNQIWMAENLNVDRFRNGDLIPQAKTDDEWKATSENGKPAWCYYDNDSKNGEKYGKLYNWYAVIDPRGLAPVGYHIPSNAEWTVLTDYLGGEVKAGAKMKSKQGWAQDGNGTNSSGFSGLSGGLRGSNGSFRLIGEYGSWWSSAESNSGAGAAWGRDLGYYYGIVGRYGESKDGGFSVRCLRD